MKITIKVKKYDAILMCLDRHGEFDIHFSEDELRQLEKAELEYLAEIDGKTINFPPTKEGLLQALKGKAEEKERDKEIAQELFRRFLAEGEDPVMKSNCRYVIRNILEHQPESRRKLLSKEQMAKYQKELSRREKIAAELNKKCAERERAEEELTKKLRAERERAKEERAKKEREEMEAWIAAHGSDHLRICIQEEIGCTKIYLKERMQTEFLPSAMLYSDVCGYFEDFKDPPPEATTALKLAREKWPEKELKLAFLDTSDNDYHAEECDLLQDRICKSRHVIRHDFLGTDIILEISDILEY